MGAEYGFVLSQKRSTLSEWLIIVSTLQTRLFGKRSIPNDDTSGYRTLRLKSDPICSSWAVMTALNTFTIFFYLISVCVPSARSYTVLNVHLRHPNFK